MPSAPDELRPDETDVLVVPVGRFITNFGMLEAISRDVVDRLAPGTKPEGRFASRVRQILKLSAALHLSAELSEQWTNTWKQARALAVKRNDIAHGHVATVFENGQKVGPFVLADSQTSLRYRRYGAPDIAELAREAGELTVKLAFMVHQVRRTPLLRVVKRRKQTA